MKRKLKKIKRIKKFYEQKKNIRMLELQKAIAERMRRKKRCSLIESRKSEYLENIEARLNSEIDLNFLMNLEGGLAFFNESLKRAASRLNEAARAEAAKRTEAVDASIEHKVWENLYGKHEKRVRRYYDLREEREIDDLALLRRMLNERSC